jgi:hypothetical protein
VAVGGVGVKGVNRGVGWSEVRLAPLEELWCDWGLQKFVSLQ